MKLYRTTLGCMVEEDGSWWRIAGLDWDEVVVQDGLLAFCRSWMKDAARCDAPRKEEVLAPIQNQEVWAAGVTYYRSRSARMEESKEAGGGDFYDRVYHAARPELFFKATGPRVVGPEAGVAIRSDASWSVPEPELTLLIQPSGTIVGYTIGNDMSSRDIEGENPLYLPQAKMYARSCALGPCVLLSEEAMPQETLIAIEILRGGRQEFAGTVQLTELKRDPKVLVEYLFRDNAFAQGCYLMTGTGVVPPDGFTLQHGDRIEITIAAIGMLGNVVI